MPPFEDHPSVRTVTTALTRVATRTKVAVAVAVGAVALGAGFAGMYATRSCERDPSRCPTPADANVTTGRVVVDVRTPRQQWSPTTPTGTLPTGVTIIARAIVRNTDTRLPITLESLTVGLATDATFTASRRLSVSVNTSGVSTEVGAVSIPAGAVTSPQVVALSGDAMRLAPSNAVELAVWLDTTDLGGRTLRVRVPPNGVRWTFASSQSTTTGAMPWKTLTFTRSSSDDPRSDDPREGTPEVREVRPPYFGLDGTSPSGVQVPAPGKEVLRFWVQNDATSDHITLRSLDLELVSTPHEPAGITRAVRIVSTDRSRTFGTFTIPSTTPLDGRITVPLVSPSAPSSSFELGSGTLQVFSVLLDTTFLGDPDDPQQLIVNIPSGGLAWSSVSEPSRVRTDSFGVPVTGNPLTYN